MTEIPRDYIQDRVAEIEVHQTRELEARALAIRNQIEELARKARELGLVFDGKTNFNITESLCYGASELMAMVRAGFGNLGADRRRKAAQEKP